MNNLTIDSGRRILESYDDITKVFKIYSYYSSSEVCLFEGEVKSSSLRSKIKKAFRIGEITAANTTKNRIIQHIEAAE